MRIETLRRLLTPMGQEALQLVEAAKPREEDFLAHYQALSRRYEPELARAALEIAIARIKAAAKFPFASQLYATREALEQASNWEISTYRAGRYRPYQRAIDLGCSIGGDTLALAGVVPTLGVDMDALRLMMARLNAQALGLNQQADFIQADLRVALPFQARRSSSVAFFDPARRREGRRVWSVEAYQPPLSIVKDWLLRFSGLGVKISPGVKLIELRQYDAEVEFISLNGELKEAVLWFSELKTTDRRATLLPGAHSLTAETDSPAMISDPRAFLYEPDPAILRAGLVRRLAELLGAAQLDPEIAYLTAEQRRETPFARSWQVEDWFPFNLKRLRAYLHEHRIGRVTIKKRGSPLQPEALLHDLRLAGEEERVLFLTRVRGKPAVIVAREEQTQSK